MTEIPEKARSILDRHVVAHLATIGGDGSPQLTPIWVERNGDSVSFSTAEGRAKVRNLRRDPRLAISFVDPDASDTAFILKGRAVAIEQRGWDLIDRLARAYRGSDGFPRIEGMVRVDVDVEIDRVIG
jgi:PPOX class probable F420-dependent enzyme